MRANAHEPVDIDFDPLAHPALTAPKTKEDWRDYLTYIDPVRPRSLTRAKHDALSREERIANDLARHDWHSALVLAETSQILQFEKVLGRVMRVNSRSPHGAKTGIIVSGASRTGKSTMVKEVARRFENQLRTRHPEHFNLPGNDVIPVAYLLVPDTVTVKALLLSLAEYYGLPFSQRITAAELMTLVVKAISACRTYLLIIDDLHFLDVSDREGARANNMLKSLADKTGITFVAVGVDLEEGKLFTEGNGSDRATQTSGRYILYKTRPYDLKRAADRTEWIALVHLFEDSLVLLDHKPGTLAREWEYLNSRTGGSICSLALLVSQAAIEAQLNGSEAVTVEFLETLPNDYLSEYKRARRQKVQTGDRLTPRRGRVHAGSR